MHQCAALPDPQLFTQKHAVFLSTCHTAAIFLATKFSLLRVWSTLRQLLMESWSLFLAPGEDQGFLKLMSNGEHSCNDGVVGPLGLPMSQGPTFLVVLAEKRSSDALPFPHPERCSEAPSVLDTSPAPPHTVSSY